MKYPAILRNILGNQTVLAVNAKLFIHMSGEFELEDSESYSFDSHYTNITHEYLSNTWGVVESKEHAEFIIELAESHGFELLKDGLSNKNYFHIGEKSFALFINEPTFKGGCKQITIPLPPKAEEWPQVGDEVLAFDIGIHDGRKGSFIGKNKHGAPIVELESGSVILLGFEGKMKKPKSKQDLLIEDLQTKLCNNNAVDNYILACDIINGDIEGLSYGSVDKAKLKLSAMIDCRYSGLITPTDMGREIKKIADEAADFILSKYNLTEK